MELELKTVLTLAIGIALFFVEPTGHGRSNSIDADKDSSFISYHVYHLFHSVDGVSKQVRCDIDVDSAVHKIIEVSAEAEVNSFDSGNEARDKTALSAIESIKYPVVGFQSDSISYDSDKMIRIKGKLKFHGVTRETTIPVSVISKMGKTICDGSIQLDFNTFNVKRPSLIFIPIGDTFIVRFHMVFDSQL